MSRQQSNVNKQRRGTKRKAKSQTDSSTSGQPLRHDYYDRQFSIAYIHYSRYSLARGAEYKLDKAWSRQTACIKMFFCVLILEKKKKRKIYSKNSTFQDKFFFKYICFIKVLVF